MREVEILALGLFALGAYLLSRPGADNGAGEPVYQFSEGEAATMTANLPAKDFYDVTALITSQNGRAQIIEHEGWRREAYRDTKAGGVWTIGVGHLIVPGDGLSPTSVLTDAQVDELLTRDIWNAEESVMRRVAVPVTQGMFDALVDFAFQFGDSKFAGSTLLKKLNAGDYAGVAGEFRRWVYSGGVVVAGLVNRREDNVTTFFA